MIFKTLKKSDLSELNKAFNLAFENYFVDISMTPDQFKERYLKVEKIDFDLSGAFFNEKGEILAFIIHVLYDLNGNLFLHNAGTGVIPASRGKGLTKQLYTELLLQIEKKGITNLQLEVITENTRAIHTYESIGFQKSRELNFYRLPKVNFNSFERNKKVREIEFQRDFPFEEFSDYLPSLSCIPSNLYEVKDQLKCFGYYEENILYGLAIVNPSSGRLSYLGVHKEYRRNGIGRTLFEAAVNESIVSISVLNVPSDAKVCNQFLQKMGMEIQLSQYEMKYSNM